VKGRSITCDTDQSSLKSTRSSEIYVQREKSYNYKKISIQRAIRARRAPCNRRELFGWYIFTRGALWMEISVHEYLRAKISAYSTINLSVTAAPN